ncbi:MAG: hypothetical protein V2I32_09065 [Desulforhopalus sp.]|nr:hypothetical protein [Desulforhopalus sp.]
MKEHYETISPALFPHFPPARSTRPLKMVLARSIRRLDNWLKSHRDDVAATVVIGAILLFGISLFLRQLAEYGW